VECVIHGCELNETEAGMHVCVRCMSNARLLQLISKASNELGAREREHKEIWDMNVK
jgi:hypothetical protein